MNHPPELKVYGCARYGTACEFKKRGICTRCSAHFHTCSHMRHRLCFTCRNTPLTPEQKQANKEQAKAAKLPKSVMTVQDVHRWLERGEVEFHNGGKRRRRVVGAGMMIMYTTSSSPNMVTSVWADAFAKWCRGVVVGGVMCNRIGKPLEGASEDGTNTNNSPL